MKRQRLSFQDMTITRDISSHWRIPQTPFKKQRRSMPVSELKHHHLEATPIQSRTKYKNKKSIHLVRYTSKHHRSSPKNKRHKNQQIPVKTLLAIEAGGRVKTLRVQDSDPNFQNSILRHMSPHFGVYLHTHIYLCQNSHHIQLLRDARKLGFLLARNSMAQIDLMAG